MKPRHRRSAFKSAINRLSIPTIPLFAWVRVRMKVGIRVRVIELG